MKHIVSTIIVICLCIAFCDAQTIRIKVPISLLQNQDSIAKCVCEERDSANYVLQLERTFKRRTNERIWQLTELFSYLCDKEESEQAKTHYSNIATKLFADDTKVIIRNDSVHSKEMSVGKFIKQLITDHTIAFVTLDSIEVPKWDYALIESDTLGIVYAESEMIAVHTAKEFSGTHTRLPIVNDETEDGTEWIPLFGKMIVIITYKNEKNRKNNRSNLDAISDKLR